VADLCASDAVTLAGMLRRREVSAREVVAAHAARIEALDGVINAVVTRSLERAISLAGARRRGAGPRLRARPAARPASSA
jgi:amidase